MYNNLHIKEASPRDEIISGLLANSKRLPSKLFYDEKGSALFDMICNLDEYYLTRTEVSIMKHNIKEITDCISGDSALIELGSGSSIKTRLLFDNMRTLPLYIPVDISYEHLMRTAEVLKQDYPGLRVHPVNADFSHDFELPFVALQMNLRKILYYPGSTIGNFTPREAARFLKRVSGMLGHGGGLLIGVDMKKDPNVLHMAYNDSKGITAKFNLNILERLNADYNADFDIGNFYHKAVYNKLKGRIEMYLISTKTQSANIFGKRIHFLRGEKILTEYSYKYSDEGFSKLVSEYFRSEYVWTDDNNYFSIWYLKVR
ncbi:MAG: L-histidine N(alpha)-methyltransferase [Ignavibacteriales bacterium]